MSFITLPPELHTALADYLPSSALVSLSRTSQTLRNIYAPLSFQWVMIVDEREIYYSQISPEINELDPIPSSDPFILPRADASDDPEGDVVHSVPPRYPQDYFIESFSPVSRKRRAITCKMAVMPQKYSWYKNKCVVDISVGRSCSTGVRGVLLSERCEECYHLKTLNDPDSQKLTYPESLISLTLPTDFRPPQDLDSYYPSLTHTGPFCINHLPSFDYHVKFPRCDSSNPFCVQKHISLQKILTSLKSSTVVATSLEHIKRLGSAKHIRKLAVRFNYFTDVILVANPANLGHVNVSESLQQLRFDSLRELIILEPLITPEQEFMLCGLDDEDRYREVYLLEQNSMFGKLCDALTSCPGLETLEVRILVTYSNLERIKNLPQHIDNVRLGIIACFVHNEEDWGGADLNSAVIEIPQITEIVDSQPFDYNTMCFFRVTKTPRLKSVRLSVNSFVEAMQAHADLGSIEKLELEDYFDCVLGGDSSASADMLKFLGMIGSDAHDDVTDIATLRHASTWHNLYRLLIIENDISVYTYTIDLHSILRIYCEPLESILPLQNLRKLAVTMPFMFVIETYLDSKKREESKELYKQLKDVADGIFHLARTKGRELMPESSEYLGIKCEDGKDRLGEADRKAQFEEMLREKFPSYNDWHRQISTAIMNPTVYLRIFQNTTLDHNTIAQFLAHIVAFEHYAAVCMHLPAIEELELAVAPHLWSLQDKLVDRPPSMGLASDAIALYRRNIRKSAIISDHMVSPLGGPQFNRMICKSKTLKSVTLVDVADASPELSESEKNLECADYIKKVVAMQTGKAPVKKGKLAVRVDCENLQVRTVVDVEGYRNRYHIFEHC